MKNLFTLLFLFVFTLSFSQNTIPIVEETIIKTETTFDKVYSDVKEGLKGLGEALKVGSEHVYTILVKQQIVNAFLWSTILLISIFLLTYCFRKGMTLGWSYHSYWRDEWVDQGGKEAWEKTQSSTKNVYIIILSIISFFMFTIGMGHIDIIFTGFLNPEYGAMQDIVKFIK